MRKVVSKVARRGDQSADNGHGAMPSGKMVPGMKVQSLVARLRKLRIEIELVFSPWELTTWA